MKRFFQLFALFLLSFQLSAFNDADATLLVDSICDVSISIDSTVTGFILTAEPTGSAPFTYSWSNGETTQSIIPSELDTGYCVTVIDADGCEAWGCFWGFPQNCGVTIAPNPSGGLTALATGSAPFTYSWNIGATTETITPTDPGYYCVNTTDAEGCTASQCYWYAGNPDSCSVTIYPDSSIIGSGEVFLYAASTGTGPFTYQWDYQNATTSAVQVPASGSYCVTITSATGCTASNCIDLDNYECSVIVFEAIWSGQLVASGEGLGAVEYAWSTGETDYAISPTEPGEYCVTVTALNGCSSSDCITLDSVDCSPNLSLYQGDSSGVTIIDAIATGVGPLSYLWSTGETTQYIAPTTEGEYCVTVTAANGCTETGCVNFDLNLQIQGWVYLPDSLDPVYWEGYAELYQFDADGNLSLHSSIDIATDPSGYFAFYDFGDVDPGTYLVKAGINEDEPISGDYLPTYYGNVIEWDLATTIGVPVSQWYHNITLTEGQMLLEGGGEINGFVLEGDNFKGGDIERDPEDPIAGVSILLFDEMEEPITHTHTDVNGEYVFGELPFGTYKVMVEIAGKEQAEHWVTLSADEPVASGVDFDVNSTSVVNGVSEWVGEQGFAVFPNPTSGQLFVGIESTRQFEGQLTLTSLTGSTVLAQPKNIAAGGQRIALDIAHLPTGVYFLQLNTGKEVLSRKVVKD